MNRVLIVEDDRNMSGALSLYFEMRGWEVICAETGKEGLEKAGKLKPDLVLLDMSLPQLNGQQVCQKLKRDPALRHIPVIMMTGQYKDVQDRVKGLELGADDYFLKPVEPQQLFARSEAIVLSSRERLQRAAEVDR